MRFLVRSGSDRAVLLLGCLLIALMAVATTMASLYLRERSEQDWRDQLRYTSLAMAGYTSQTLTSAHLVLDRVASRISGLQATSAADLRSKAATPEVHRFLRERSESSPQIQAITVVGADGDVVAFSRTFPAPPINLADRDDFAMHKAQRDVGPLISSPVRSRDTGTWTFYISRRLENADGEFIGVVLVGLSCAHLTEVYDKIALGIGGVVTLFRSDLVRLAVSPPDDARMGAMVTQWPSPAMVNTDGPEWQVEMRPEVQAESLERQTLDGMRMVVGRRVPGYPVILGMGVPESTLYSRWYPALMQLATVLTLGVLAVLFAMVVLLRLVRRLDRSRLEAIELARRADSANASKSDFLATVSHEIRTPLTGILGFSELLLDSKLNEVQRDCAGMVHKASQGLLDIINEILDFAKIESGHLELRVAPFNPAELLREVGALYAPAARGKNLELEVRCDDGLPSVVMGDPVRLRQVLCNLVNNAVKFTERGSVCVHLGADRVAQHGHRIGLRFSVTDTGVGIDAAAVPKVFEPFRQLDHPNQWQQGGTGLGLAISKRLVALMGGTIQVASTPGQGTRFEIALELEVATLEVASAAQAAAAAGALPRPRPRRALA